MASWRWNVYSFRQNSRTWRTHKQTDTAWQHRPHLHSIARQKLKITPGHLRRHNSRTTKDKRMHFDDFYRNMTRLQLAVFTVFRGRKSSTTTTRQRTKYRLQNTLPWNTRVLGGVIFYMAAPDIMAYSFYRVANKSDIFYTTPTFPAPVKRYSCRNFAIIFRIEKLEWRDFQMKVKKVWGYV